jgi:mevalonate kinase
LQLIKANGKLLLTAEYFVLDGARAIALPTKLGQNMMVVKEQSHKSIIWEALDSNNNIWMSTEFSNESFEILKTNDVEKSKILIKIFQYCLKHTTSDSIKIALNTGGLKFTTKLDFDANWGLGSSSTLISLFAQWANINPYELLKITFGGSGYDIACATATKPILYNIFNNKAKIEEVNFSPEFIGNLYFIYLGKKQNSREGINYYNKLKSSNIYPLVDQISSITDTILALHSLNDFEYYIKMHEDLISNYLKIDKIKDLYFKDYSFGVLKSLGAWGGDFILATSNENYNSTIKYFKNKGFKTIFKYSEIII